MATTAPDTGVGAVAALTTATFSMSVTNIGEIREVVEMVDVTHLGIVSTSLAQFVAGDNPVAQDIPIAFLFDAEVASPRARANAQDTLTITLPIANTSNTQAMTVVIAGCVKEQTINPQLARNQANSGSMVFSPNGTSLVVTPET